MMTLCVIFMGRTGGKRIGAVLKKFAPFLKIYKDYILQFDNACSLITTWTAKSTKFAAFLEEIQVTIIEFCFAIRVLDGIT